MRPTDRILKLKWIENKIPITNAGMVDRSLFTGGNKLHAVMEPDGLWKMYYERGTLDQALRMRFTSFSALFKYASEYFQRRNIKVEED